ncbi:unnamed protein product [Cyprideis torosa]|uniref:Uncharacterized protein n=1 Tax=Cyprideis torosa TaxID=163714 RepID=A0A7R8VZY7_9CRUS|nr:unnamed protein product [Cyprideis torosa]CAG0879189.1 unnamed protein product [Cyprideis torosa]
MYENNFCFLVEPSLASKDDGEGQLVNGGNAGKAEVGMGNGIEAEHEQNEGEEENSLRGKLILQNVISKRNDFYVSGGGDDFSLCADVDLLRDDDTPKGKSQKADSPVKGDTPLCTNGGANTPSTEETLDAAANASIKESASEKSHQEGDKELCKEEGSNGFSADVEKTSKNEEDAVKNLSDDGRDSETKVLLEKNVSDSKDVDSSSQEAEDTVPEEVVEDLHVQDEVVEDLSSQEDVVEDVADDDSSKEKSVKKDNSGTTNEAPEVTGDSKAVSETSDGNEEQKKSDKDEAKKNKKEVVIVEERIDPKTGEMQKMTEVVEDLIEDVVEEMEDAGKESHDENADDPLEVPNKEKKDEEKGDDAIEVIEEKDPLSTSPDKKSIPDDPLAVQEDSRSKDSSSIPADPLSVTNQEDDDCIAIEDSDPLAVSESDPLSISGSSVNTQSPSPSIPVGATPVCPEEIILAEAMKAFPPRVMVESSLEDEVAVVEAPSFVVPYLYEQAQSKAKLQSYLEELKKEIEVRLKEEKRARIEAKKERRKRRGRKNSGDEEDDVEDEDYNADEEGESSSESEISSDEGGAGFHVTKTVTPLKTADNANPADFDIETFFEGPVGKWLADIGSNLVQEYAARDLIRMKRKKERRPAAGASDSFLSLLSKNLEISKKKNDPLRLVMEKCPLCRFKSESLLTLGKHLESPHYNHPYFHCNFCPFFVRNGSVMVTHIADEHGRKTTIENPIPLHQCSFCAFETNAKATLIRHQKMCMEKYNRNPKILTPHPEWSPPVKISRIAYKDSKSDTYMQKKLFENRPPFHLLVLRSEQESFVKYVKAILDFKQRKASSRSMAITRPQGVPVLVTAGGLQSRFPSGTTTIQPTTRFRPSGLSVASPSVAVFSKSSSNAAPPRRSVPANAESKQLPPPAPPASGAKPTAGAPQNKHHYIVCEICDVFLQDKTTLLSHFLTQHEIPMSSSKIQGRPPLGCQKCAFRFFTDQGLERHLLGSHGLVTSVMQNAANKKEDKGMCPVCGREFPISGLLNHVAKDHGFSLKPAYLSYKCVVCTASFSVYRDFEQHVYNAHVSNVRKQSDAQKSVSGPKGTGTSQETPAKASEPKEKVIEEIDLIDDEDDDDISVVEPVSKKAKSS